MPLQGARAARHGPLNRHTAGPSTSCQMAACSLVPVQLPDSLRAARCLAGIIDALREWSTAGVGPTIVMGLS